MSLINIRPQELRMAAFRMIFKGRSIKGAINAVDKEIKSLGEDTFSGESAVRLRMDYQKYRTHLLSSSDLIVRFAGSLIDVANDFEKADRKQAFSISMPIFLGVGLLTNLIHKILPSWGKGNLDNFPWVKGSDSAGDTTGETGGGVVSDGGAAIENVSHDTGVVYQDGDYLKADLDTNPPPTKNGTWKGNCGAYVQALVPNINNTSRGSAANWIEDYNLQPFSSDNDLRTHLEPGDVVVWPATGEDNKGHQGANNVHGHASVIIEVHEDHVVLAESSWDYDNIPQSPRIGRILNRVKLNDGLYVWSNPEINQNQTEVLYG